MPPHPTPLAAKLRPGVTPQVQQIEAYIDSFGTLGYDGATMNGASLSPSTLNLFQECPRCFWLEKVKGLRRPRGIFPSLPGGMDRIIKTYFDEYRAKKEVPPLLAVGDFEGIRLFADQSRLNQWRSWRTGLQYRDRDGSVLSGALDDLLVKGGRHIPFDYKTKGSPASQESAVQYYQLQLDCYALLLEENALAVTDYGILLFYSPKSVGEGGQVLFAQQPIRVPTDVERARKTFREAVALLNGPMPAVGGACEYCQFAEKRAGGQRDLFM